MTTNILPLPTVSELICCRKRTYYASGNFLAKSISLDNTLQTTFSVENVSEPIVSNTIATFEGKLGDYPYTDNTKLALRYYGLFSINVLVNWILSTSQDSMDRLVKISLYKNNIEVEGAASYIYSSNQVDNIKTSSATALITMETGDIIELKCSNMLNTSPITFKTINFSACEISKIKSLV